MILTAFKLFFLNDILEIYLFAFLLWELDWHHSHMGAKYERTSKQANCACKMRDIS